jgi:tetratricopeptide (TPR) repeat protein
MSGPALSRYTPSLMPPELLERLFVARERLLDSIMARVESAGTGSGRNHTLLVGPRGAGKTHLVSLAQHRATSLKEAGLRIQLSWLPEDPWTIVSYRHLLAAIARAVPLGAPASATEAELEELIALSATEHGPVVVFLENLDAILDAIGPQGQQSLRHLLQDSRALLLVATTTSLDRNLSDQSRPFYGFFTTTRLEPFDVEEATSMLSAIASATDQPALAEYLETDEGQARVRAIAHLAGGQPRMWSALAASLSIGGLSELVELLLTRFDDLTPYYQERLAKLSGRQRLVVSELAVLDRPVNVKELAGRIDVDQRSLGKTMSDLTERGWAAPVSSPLLDGLVDRRLTYYELAEPLARLAFQIKEARGEPLRLVVDFLKNWFDPIQLSEESAADLRAYVESAVLAQDADPVVSVTRQLHRLPVTRAPAVELLGDVDDALSELDQGQPQRFLTLPTPIRSAIEVLANGQSVPDVRVVIHYLAMQEFGHVRHPSMDAWIDRASSLASTGEVGRLVTVRWLGRAWRFDDALAGLDRGDTNVPSEPTIDARGDVAFSAWAAGRFEDAVALEEGVLADRTRMHGWDHQDTITARNNLAATYSDLGRIQEALALKEGVLADRERLLGADHLDTVRARANLAVTYADLGRHAEALAFEEAVVVDRERLLGVDHPDTLRARTSLAVTYTNLRRHDEALPAKEAVLADYERVLGPHHNETLWARAHLAVTYSNLRRHAEALALTKVALADYEQVLGPDHPDTLRMRANLAVTYSNLGQHEQARALEKAVLVDSERLLGHDHPDTLRIRANLVGTHWALGHHDDAVALEKAVLSDCERVLGVNHPDTIRSRETLSALLNETRGR